MNWAYHLVSSVLSLALISSAAASSCRFAQVDETPVAQAGDALVVKLTGLAVDADGAPNSYRVDGNGLSYTCDGVAAIENGKRVTKKTDPLHWQQKCRDAWARAKATHDYSKIAIFGFAADPKTNQPIVQKAGDPLPGAAYVTTTTVTVPNTEPDAQQHWIDATEIPYVVLPGDFRCKYRVADAALVAVYRKATNELAFAVFGDEGGFGEASVRLHQDLGHPAIAPDTDGILRAESGIENEDLVMVVFPKDAEKGGIDPAAWRASISAKATDIFEKWGGLTRLRECVGH